MSEIITKTSPYNEHPLTPHFYIVKTGVYRGIHFFLIFALKHRLWVLVRTASVLSKNKKNITIFQLKIFMFTVLKNCSILHGRFFVMIKIISQGAVTSENLLLDSSTTWEPLTDRM